MDVEKQKRIVKSMMYMIPFIVLVLIMFISALNAKSRKNTEPEEAPVMEVATVETPMSFEEEVNEATVYLANMEGNVTVRTDRYDYFAGSVSTISGQKVSNQGENPIISEAVKGENHIDYFNGIYLVEGKNLENCLFRIIPEKRNAEYNKYQYMGMTYEKANIYVGSQCCEEVAIQYKKAIYIVNQTGMFYIHFEITDEELEEELGFADINITGRVEPYGEETGEVTVNIACYVTENGFEFYSDTPLAGVSVDRNTEGITEWENMSMSNVSSFIYDGSSFEVKTIPENTPTDAETE